MSKVRRIFITVKTYPTLSEKYDELVCTAGILDDGRWARVYPLPFRKLDYEKRYKKFQWVELCLEKNKQDPRPESYKGIDISRVRLIGQRVGTERKWAKRKEIIFEKNPIYKDLRELIDKANKNKLSIAVFKATEILDLTIEETKREWSKKNLATLKEKAKQLSLFQTTEEIEKEFRVVKKLPYKFSYKFKDCSGKVSTLMIEDWEIGALYWKCLQRSDGNEKKAIELVREKYFVEFLKKDLYLFLGTTRQFHGWAKNPFVIIGVFYPPIDKQMKLL